MTNKNKCDIIVSRYLTGGEKLRIKELRGLKNLTQEDLAQELNVERSTVAMWEADQAMPRADKLPELARILECTIDELYEKEV